MLHLVAFHRCMGAQKRGRKSNRAVPQKKREEIAQIIEENYKGCKPFFISEKLAQYHALKYSSEFIRQLMTEYQLWFPKRKKINTHPRRERRESIGELLQADASDHNWFEGRGPRSHLHLFIDDASSSIEGGRFELEETTEGYYRAFQPILEEKGRPVHLYTDKRGVFVVNQGNKKGKTQFRRALDELQITLILAHSPQAKGRIERAFKTLQERLVWEMRIRGINTLEEANHFLPKYLEEHNKKYARSPKNPSDAYRPLNKNKELKYILCKKTKRKVTKNLEIQYNNDIYQLTPPSGISLRNQKITVITTLDNEIFFEYQGHLLDAVQYEDRYTKPKQSLYECIDKWKNKREIPKTPIAHPCRKQGHRTRKTV